MFLEELFMKKIVIFKCASEEFGLYVENVLEVRRQPEVIPVPHAPEFVDGIAHVRGHPVAIIDLSKRLGLAKKDITAKSRIIIVKSKGTIVGFTADIVSEVLEIADKGIEDAPKLAIPINDNYISGIIDIKGRMIIILNVDELLSSEEVEKIKLIKKSQITNKKSQ